MTEQQNNGAAIAKRDERAEGMEMAGGLRPSNLAEAMELARLYSNSQFVPEAYKGNAGDVLAAINMGAEVGLAPMAALQNIAVINGRPSVWGDAALAICRVHRDFAGIKETVDAAGATCVVSRVERGRVVEYSATFTMEDAKVAGLASKAGPWKTYPKRMMQMRARGFALRDAFPDALRGLSIGEESQDIVIAEAVEVVEPATAIEAPKKGAAALKSKIAAPAEADAAPAIPKAAERWIAEFNKAPDTDEVAAVVRDVKEVWNDLDGASKAAIRVARTAAENRTAEAAALQESD